MKRKLGAIIYYFFAKHLPPSYSGVNVGQKRLREICGRLMMDSCGENVNIEKGALFSKHVTLGNFSGIGVNAKIYGTCVIGEYVMMGEDCTIITRNHRFSDVKKPMMFQGFDDEKPVVIGNDVWIGDKVTILPGVHIGDGCIIGAGTIVTHDLAAYSVVVGAPAKVIKMRT